MKLIKKLSLFGLLLVAVSGTAFAEVSEEAAYVFNTFSFLKTSIIVFFEENLAF